jgi:hypothetical protein
VTLATLLQPGWLLVLVAWSFAVLSAAQLTIRLIMAFSVRVTLIAALVLSALALVVAAVWDVVLGPDPTLAARLESVPLPMALMGLAGFGAARWVLRIKRLRGQIIAGVMVGVLAPHVFTVLASS